MQCFDETLLVVFLTGCPVSIDVTRCSDTSDQFFDDMTGTYATCAGVKLLQFTLHALLL
jgi:hypothetical protein